MPDTKDKDKSWTGRTSARHYIVWMILWILTELAIITWIFAFAYGEAGASSKEFFTTNSVSVNESNPGSVPAGAAERRVKLLR